MMTVHSIKCCLHSAWLIFVTQPICIMRLATRECLYSIPSCSLGLEGIVWLSEVSLVDSWWDDYFSTDFRPAMTSDQSSMTYKLELLKNRWVHNFLAMCSSAQTYWQWTGPKFHSLLSAHHLIDAYFFTTESDKRMRFFTVYHLCASVSVTTLAAAYLDYMLKSRCC